MISAPFNGKPFSITVIQVYVPMNDAEEVETEQFDEDLWELMPPSKDVFFIMGNWNAKVWSQELPGVTGKLALEYKRWQVKC